MGKAPAKRKPAKKKVGKGCVKGWSPWVFEQREQQGKPSPCADCGYKCTRNENPKLRGKK